MKHRTLDNTLHSSLAVGFACVVVAALLFTGCASQPDIRRDRDPAVDLNAYKTFGFFESMPADSLRYTTLVNTRLKQAAREQLGKHYAYSEHNPDLRVNLWLNVIDKRELRSTPAGFHGYRAWSSQLETVDYRQGTLRIDLVDPKRNALVWQGVAEGRIDTKALSEPGASVDAVVQQIFAGFPGTRGAQ
jgi:Domain of unknown function (DUF4136)